MWMSLHVTTTLRTDIVIWDHRKLLHTDVIPLMLFHPPDMMHLHSVMDVLQTQMETISWVTDVGICPLSCLLVCPPQVGVSVMDSISPHTASASWYKAAPLWTWMETQLLFGFVYMSERERERERETEEEKGERERQWVCPMLPGFRQLLMETDSTYSSGTTALIDYTPCLALKQK